MGACAGKRCTFCRRSEDSLQEENKSDVRISAQRHSFSNALEISRRDLAVRSSEDDEFEEEIYLTLKPRPITWAILPVAHVESAPVLGTQLHEIDEQDEAPPTTTMLHLLICKLYDLPLEVLDTILQKSYLHWSLNSPKRQRDEEVIRSLISVDVCFNRRITRKRFKRAVWRYLRNIYDKTKKRSAIIRSNRSYLLETVQPTDEFINSLFSLNCLTEEQRHNIQRQRLQLDKNAELLHVVGFFDDAKFSTFVKCLRQTNQAAVARIVRNGGAVIKVEVTNCGASFTDKWLLHQNIEDLRNGTKPRTQETDLRTSQLKDAGIEMLNCQVDRQTVVVWIWCCSQAASEYIQKLYESNLLKDILFDLANIRSSTSDSIQPIAINIDKNQFMKTIAVVRPISVNFTERINVGSNETVCGVAKLGNEIYVLCQPFPRVIRIFHGRSPFCFLEEIGIKEMEDPKDIQSIDKENCLYVSDQREKCVWKITRQTDYQHIVIRWLTLDYAPHCLSVSRNGHLLLVTAWSSILDIYGSDAELLRLIHLPRDIEDSIHAVETSMGNFVILHQCMETEEELESRPNGRSKKWAWTVSEFTREGQMVRRFIPLNETQKLKNPRYITLDSNDQVFVTDTGNDRVILLDPDLKWNRILCSSNDEHHEEEEEETKIRRPLRSYYDERQKQLIVGGGYFYLGGFNIYAVRRY